MISLLSAGFKALGEDAIFFARKPEQQVSASGTLAWARPNSALYPFGYARTALKYGLISMDYQAGDALLIPELICESLLDPLVESGVQPIYYPVTPTLEPDWDRLENLLVKSVKGLVIVHYFGQPQSIEKSVSFCHKHALMLIEDNAHGYGGTYDHRLLGTFGEIGISAPRKSFPIRNGAFLHLPENKQIDFSSIQLKQSSSGGLLNRGKRLSRQLPLVKSMLKKRRQINEYRKRSGPPVSYGSQEAFRDPSLNIDYGMDEAVEQYLARQDMAKVKTLRQNIYYLWREWAMDQGLSPIFPRLASGAIPLVFPAFASSKKDSLCWFERGHRAGVDIHSWPTLPRCIVKKNSVAMRMWERLVCFPIHQEMDMQILERRLPQI
jgi:hypothetical protein